MDNTNQEQEDLTVSPALAQNEESSKSLNTNIHSQDKAQKPTKKKKKTYQKKKISMQILRPGSRKLRTTFRKSSF